MLLARFDGNKPTLDDTGYYIRYTIRPRYYVFLGQSLSFVGKKLSDDACMVEFYGTKSTVVRADGALHLRH